MRTKKIYGPPGTGKTYTLLNIFEEELKHVKPDRIGFCTFTRTARLEALERTKLSEEEVPYIKTLHAICYKLLRVRHDQLVMPKHLKDFGKKIGVHLSGYMPDVLSLESVVEGVSSPTKADKLLQLNHLGRHKGLMLRETLRYASPDLDFAYAKWFTESYRQWKRENDLLDYTDLLTKYLDEGNPLGADVLFIDEAQDLSWLQWRVVHKLGGRVERRYLAGDDDQAIFIWAGASAEMFNTEQADEVEVLPQSHRIGHAVHRVSQQIISRVRIRQPKEFKPRDAEGTYRPVGRLEANLFGEGSALVLFRNHHRGIKLAAELEELGIPFKGSHGVLGQQMVRDALSGWFRKVLGNQELTLAEAKGLAEFVPRGFHQGGLQGRLESNKVTLPITAVLNSDVLQKPWDQALCKLPKLSYLQRVINRHGVEGALGSSINLLSIHQSKGREADTVILDMELARRTYEAYMQEPDDEHRVYYVAVTRARDNLYTLMPSDPMAYVI